jgi:hypothetical protein
MLESREAILLCALCGLCEKSPFLSQNSQEKDWFSQRAQSSQSRWRRHTIQPIISTTNRSEICKNLQAAFTRTIYPRATQVAIIETKAGDTG